MIKVSISHSRNKQTSRRCRCRSSANCFNESRTRSIKILIWGCALGEIWFGEDSAEKMVDWVVETKEIPKDKRIIDLGCGNGHLIFALYELEYKNLLGVDYSPLSIELCETIQKQQGVPTDALNWMKIDILNHQEAARMGLFDVVLDKGTFDAISLASREEGQSPSPANRYVESVAEMLDSDGILLITSCNWTEDELISRFSNRFTLLDRVKYPSFKFGGIYTLYFLALQL